MLKMSNLNQNFHGLRKFAQEGIFAIQNKLAAMGGWSNAAGISSGGRAAGFEEIRGHM
jgi:hypothetical protein